MIVGSWLLAACGVALIGIGGYFVAVRPPLLPEDARFMGRTSRQIFATAPQLAAWLHRVFSVMGAFIATTGLLVAYVALTGVREGDAGAVAILAFAGIMSVGLMVAVNFALRSDFRWALLSLAIVWAAGVLSAVIAL